MTLLRKALYVGGTGDDCGIDCDNEERVIDEIDLLFLPSTAMDEDPTSEHDTAAASIKGAGRDSKRLPTIWAQEATLGVVEMVAMVNVDAICRLCLWPSVPGL